MEPMLVISGASLAGAAAFAAWSQVRWRCAARQRRLVGCLQSVARQFEATPDPYLALPAVLSDLGQALGCLRLELHEIHEPVGGGMPLSSLRCAWVAPGQRDRSSDPLQRGRPWHPERSRWFSEMTVGRAFAAVSNDLPLAERTLLDGAGAIALAPVAAVNRLRAVIMCYDRGVRRDDTGLDALRLLAAMFAHALERTETTLALTAAQAEAEAGERAKREFLANISHELRTPLNGVLGMTGLLLDSQLDQRQKEYAQVVRSSAENLHTLVNDLIDLANSTGEDACERTRTDPLRLIEDVVAMLADRAHAKGLEIAVEPAPGLPRRVVCDPTRLRQVLVNLVGNAIKFTGRGHILVRIGWGEGGDHRPLIGVPAGATPVNAATRRRGAATRLELTVSDTGIGMDPGVQARLFGIFAQGDGSTTRRYGGTGLGLAIVRRQVEIMGGTIDCDSEPGAGATFTVRIPATEGSTGGSSGRSALLQTRLVGQRVLVVDPLPEVRAAIAAVCFRIGLVAEGAPGCAEALARLTSADGERPRLVLVSAGLPGASDLPVQAGKLGGELGFILMAPLARRPTQGEVTALGFSACVVKPPRCARLIEAASRALSEPDEGSSEETATHVRRSLKVLVVEDDAVNQMLAKAVLEREGYRVDLAGDGHEALEAIARAGYDAIIMDLLMPVMDGFACTTEIRRQEAARGLPRLPIIALTALTDVDLEGRCTRAGVDAMMHKPFEPKHLRRILKRLVPEARPSTARA
jgi:signal transduction histidine kinase/CheY-like chemotaxis protein